MWFWKKSHDARANIDFLKKLWLLWLFVTFCDFFWKIVTWSHESWLLWLEVTIFKKKVTIEVTKVTIEVTKVTIEVTKVTNLWLEVTIFEKKSQFSKKKSQSPLWIKKIEIPKNTFSSRLLVSGRLQSHFDVFWPQNRDFFGHFWNHFFSNFLRRQN